MTRKRHPEQDGRDRPQAALACDSGEPNDPVEIADLDSFPASDPPAWIFMPRGELPKPGSSCQDASAEGEAGPGPASPSPEPPPDHEAKT